MGIMDDVSSGLSSVGNSISSGYNSVKNKVTGQPSYTPLGGRHRSRKHKKGGKSRKSKKGGKKCRSKRRR
jgi:hypothetical protein